MKIRFSVIIPSYNRMEFLHSAIESVIHQTYDEFEIFVVDDGSDDDTSRLVREFTDERLKYVRTPHRGVSFARNTGIKLSAGEYIAFLDSDDKWDRSKLEVTAEYICRYPDTKIFHTEELWYRQGRLLPQKKKHRKYSGQIYEKCLPLCCIGMSTSVVKSDLFREMGLFDTSLPACEDYDLWLRFCSKHDVILIPETLTIKDGGREDQLSNQPGLDKYRVYSLEKMLNSDLLSSELREITCKELVKKCKIYGNGARKRGKHREASIFFQKINEYCMRD